MKYLLFQLYGHMQAWGSSLPGRLRKTEDHPTKSGVLGYLGASLGIDYSESDVLDAIQDSLGFACRVDAVGTMLRDYHTISIPGNDECIPTERDYLCDASFTICVWLKDDQTYTLEQLKEALLCPKFMPYLGRRSCPPGLPDTPEIVEASCLAEAFSKYSPSDFLEPILETGETKVYWEGNDKSIKVEDTLFRYDRFATAKTRRFKKRVEYEGHILVNRSEAVCS